MIRKLVLGTASVFALAIAGAGLDFSADADNTATAQPEPSHHWLSAANLSKDDIRWVQAELRMRGLYNGSLDGVAGPETKQALLRFQQSNSLGRTARLDQETADALIGDTGVAEGSSMPSKRAGTEPMTTSSGTSDFGSQAGQK
ncbi:MAG: peptidoglycan-binding protein [Alphaproteobacteria bacterium]|nr:peptidoglycan-binding protein [Alphaproteobacteria bacterium]